MPRPKAIKHEGFYYYRLKYDNPREKAFASQWKKENRQHKVLYRNITPMIPYDQNSANVAATVVQWLGSNVGFDFLNISLGKCGYSIVRNKKG
jgi:hypothetical protein